MNNKTLENFASIKAIKDKKVLHFLREFSFLRNLTKLRVLEFDRTSENKKVRGYLFDINQNKILPYLNEDLKGGDFRLYWKSMALLFNLNLNN